MRHRKRYSGLARIAENEFTCFDGAPLARQRIDSAAFNGGLADTVLIAERIEIAGLSAKVLSVQHCNAGRFLVPLAGHGHGAAPLFFRVAEDADGQMYLAAAERLVPVLGIVLAGVKQDIGTRSHSHSKRLRKTLQRLLRHT